MILRTSLPLPVVLSNGCLNSGTFSPSAASLSLVAYESSFGVKAPAATLAVATIFFLLLFLFDFFDLVSETTLSDLTSVLLLLSRVEDFSSLVPPVVFSG